jgi:hypothetical protein
VIDPLAAEPDVACADRAVLQRQQPGHRLERGGLARAVRAEQRHDAALRYLERETAQDLDGVVVDHLQVLDGKRRDGAHQLAPAEGKAQRRKDRDACPVLPSRLTRS